MKPIIHSAILILGTAVIAASEPVGLTDARLPVPTFDITLDHNTRSGTVHLFWSVDTLRSLPGGINFELVQAADSMFADGRVRYVGPDMATYISGLKDGEYYFRVRTVNADRSDASEWSGTVVVSVEHHSLTLALSLAGLGGLVFLLTVVVVVWGTKASEREYASHSERAAGT